MTAREVARALLDREDEIALGARRPGKVLSLVALDYLLIMGAAVLCELYWNPLLYILAVMLIGGRFVGLATVAIHDSATHRVLFRNRRVNKAFTWGILWSALTPLIGLSPARFTKLHLDHHSLAGDMKNDQDVQLCARIASFSPAKVFFVLFFLPLSGILYVILFIQTNFFRTSWYRKLAAICVVAGFVTALVFDVPGARLVALYVVIPTATWGLFVNFIRAAAEHPVRREVDDGFRIAGSVFQTRDVIPTWFDRCFVTTRDINMHLTHHLFPAIPFHRLAEAQRKIAARPLYQRYGLATPGYFAFLCELLTKKNAPALPETTMSR